MDSSYSFDALIEMLEDLINESTRIPLSKKSAVDIDKMAEIIQDMRMTLPMEIQQAQKVVMDKNNIISNAKLEAESIIRKAEKRRAELLDENDIVKEARIRATEIMSEEQNKCADMLSSTNKYVDKMLKRVEEVLIGDLTQMTELLSKDINDLRILRNGLNGAPTGLPQQPVIAPVEKPGE